MKSKNKYLKQILTGSLKFLIGFLIFVLIFGALIPSFLNLFWGDDIPELNDADLMLPKISLADEKNMFMELNQINDDMIFEPQDINFVNDYLESDGWDTDFANDIFTKNQTALELWYQAARKDEFLIPSLADPAKYSIDLPVISMNHWRAINRISLAHAIWLAHIGRTQAGMDEAMKSVKIGNTIVRAQNNSLIAYLVGMATEDKGLNAIQKILTMSAGRGVNKYKTLGELERYKTGNENYSFFKGEYIIGKKVFNNLSLLFEDADTSSGILYKRYSTNRFYFKPNMTISYQADLQKQLIQNIQHPCTEPKEIEMPYNINTGSLWGIAKLYFTENAIGKLLTNLAFVALNNVIIKTCDLQIKYQDTYNQVSQL